MPLASTSRLLKWSGKYVGRNLAAIKRITEPKFRALRARQATDVATTLGWARKKVSELLSANPEWFLLIEDYWIP